MGKKIQHYTNEELLGILRKFYEENTYVRCEDFKASNGLPNYVCYVKRFGSWNEAKELAGIPINKQKNYIENKENIIKQFKIVVEKVGRIPTCNEFEELSSRFCIYNYFKNYEELINECGYKTNKLDKGKYKKDFLIEEIKRFVNEFGRIPTQKDFENLKGYPSRKTFTNHFDNFNKCIRLAGFEPVSLTKNDVNKRATKENISNLILNFINEYDKTPTIDDLNEKYGHYVRGDIRKVYGSYTNCLLELGIPLNLVVHYDDESLHSEFERFVNKNGRIPTYAEFNNSEYPSFWCYQNRFGSWNNAVIAYGYTPNDSNRKYYLEDGEICASSYEYIISNWLKEKNIKYDRNISYMDIDLFGYKGKMDCDYKIYYNNEIWYVEMAGFLRGTNFEKYSDAEKKYFFKLKYKKKLLKRSNLNYIVIEPCDIKNKEFEEVFHKMIINK